MMGALGKFAGWLFGGSKAADGIIDGARAGIDKIFYTDEEKADARREAYRLWVEYQKATAPQNVARRLIALIVTVLWSGLVLTGIVARGVEKLTGKVAAATADTASQGLLFSDFVFNVLSNNVTTVFFVVVGFYFSKRMLDRIVDGFGRRGDAGE